MASLSEAAFRYWRAELGLPESVTAIDLCLQPDMLIVATGTGPVQSVARVIPFPSPLYDVLAAAGVKS